MPRSPFPFLPELLLGAPRNICDNVCNKSGSLSIFAQEPHRGVLRIQLFEHRKKERVWIGGEWFWYVFFVKDVVEKRRKLNHEEIR